MTDLWFALPPESDEEPLPEFITIPVYPSVAAN